MKLYLVITNILMRVKRRSGGGQTNQAHKQFSSYVKNINYKYMQISIFFPGSQEKEGNKL